MLGNIVFIVSNCPHVLPHMHEHSSLKFNSWNDIHIIILLRTRDSILVCLASYVHFSSQFSSTNLHSYNSHLKKKEGKKERKALHKELELVWVDWSWPKVGTYVALFAIGSQLNCIFDFAFHTNIAIWHAHRHMYI